MENPAFQVCLVLEGEGELRWDGGSLAVKKGDELFLPHGVPRCRCTTCSGLRLLGGVLRPHSDYTIPGTEVTHRVVTVEKVRPTPKGYPRRWVKIQKSPLVNRS